MKITAFAVAGLLVGVGAIFALGPDRRRKSVLRTELLLPAYAAAFLSVTTYRPGYYNVPGIVVAIILPAVGFNGLNLLGAPFWPSRSSMAPCSSLRSSPPGRKPQKLDGAQASLPRARWNRHSASFRCGWLVKARRREAVSRVWTSPNGRKIWNVVKLDTLGRKSTTKPTVVYNHTFGYHAHFYR